MFASSGTERPASIVGVNGLNVADFDGVNDFMQVAGSTGMYNFLHDGSLGTVIFIGRIEDLNPDSSEAILNNQDVTSGKIGFGILYDDRSSLSRNNTMRQIVTNSNPTVPIINASSNNYYLTQQYNVLLLNFDANNTSAANRGLMDLNNGSIESNNTETIAPSILNASDNLTLGKQSVTNNSYLKGQMPEIIILKDIHPTPTQLTQLNAYLTNKYGGTFPII